MYLDYAEMQAENHNAMTMNDWVEKLNAFLQFNGKEILKNTGKISTLIRISLCFTINHNVFLYFDIIFHFSLLIWWHHRQSLKAVGVLGYPHNDFYGKWASPIQLVERF